MRPNIWFSKWALLSVLLSSAKSDIILPRGSGHYNITIGTTKLVDKDRPDPYAPNGTARSVMVSLFYPVLPSECIGSTLFDYMPPTTAAYEDQVVASIGVPNGTFELIKIQTCSQYTPRHHHRHHRLPVILFSPGYGVSRLLYSAIAQSVSSAGYIVVTIDHPYDADIVEFPDGSYITGLNFTTDAEFNLDLDTRVKDMSFVLDELSKASVIEALIPGAKHGLNVESVGMFGHSLGGATAASAMLSDCRIVGGINLDGQCSGLFSSKALTAGSCSGHTSPLTRYRRGQQYSLICADTNSN